MTDKRITGEQNSLTILSSLHRFGWLTTRMISSLVWYEKSQGLTLARRALKQLAEKKLVLRRETQDGTDCFTLSTRGAHVLHDELDIKTESGKSLSLGNVLHRAASNWFLIYKLRQGYKIWTEHEIQTGRAPVSGFNGKVPDGLLETDLGLTWIEVENAWKNRSERERIVHFCAENLEHLDTMVELSPNQFLFRMAVVSTNMDALRWITQSFTDAFHKGFIRESSLREIEVALLPVSPSLIPGQVIEGHLWYDIISPPLSGYHTRAPKPQPVGALGSE